MNVIRFCNSSIRLGRYRIDTICGKAVKVRMDRVSGVCARILAVRVSIFLLSFFRRRTIKPMTMINKRLRNLRLRKTRCQRNFREIAQTALHHAGDQAQVAGLPLVGRAI